MHRNKRMALFVISVQKIGNIQIHSKQWFDLYHVSVIVAQDVSTNSLQCKNANARISILALPLEINKTDAVCNLEI